MPQRTVALQNGAKVLFEPHTVPDRGREAVFVDPQGAVFAVLASSSGDPPDVLATPGEWIWSSLITRDPENDAAFYQKLFNYDVFELPASPGVQHLLLASDNYARASANTLPATSGGLAFRPSHESNPASRIIVYVVNPPERFLASRPSCMSKRWAKYARCPAAQYTHSSRPRGTSSMRRRSSDSGRFTAPARCPRANSSGSRTSSSTALVRPSSDQSRERHVAAQRVGRHHAGDVDGVLGRAELRRVAELGLGEIVHACRASGSSLAITSMRLSTPSWPTACAPRMRPSSRE